MEKYKKELLLELQVQKNSAEISIIHYEEAINRTLDKDVKILKIIDSLLLNNIDDAIYYFNEEIKQLKKDNLRFLKSKEQEETYFKLAEQRYKHIKERL